MPRNGSGTYTLPTGNPVVSGTTIESSWANTTLSDIGTAMTDSLSRSGQGGMTAAFRAADGTSSVPGVAWSSETTTGFYRAGSNDVRFVIATAEAYKVTSTEVTFSLPVATAALSATGNVSFDGGTFVFNESGADKDARFEGDTDANLLFTDASTDRVGVGTNAPATKFTVRGAVQSKEVAVRWERATDGAVAGGLGYFYDSENSVAVGAVSNHPVKLIVNDATVATLDTAGNLGVGTVTPTFGSGSGVEIQRAGISTLRIDNTADSNSFELYADTAANGINLRGRDSSPMLFWTGNTERVRIGTSGQIGIAGANYGTTGQVLMSQGSGAAPQWATFSATVDAALALLGNSRNQFFSATGTFTVPAGVTSIRAYAFGPGGAGAAGVASTTGGGGGGGGGCAYGDIAVTPGQTVDITISGSSTTVAIGATTYLTANVGGAASGGTAGTGGTASTSGVTNGGAFSGGAGGASGSSQSGGGGGSSGSPIGIGGVGGAGLNSSSATGGAGGGWGGAGSIAQDSSVAGILSAGGGGAGGAGDRNAGGGAGGAAASDRGGIGRGFHNAFSDALTRPLMFGGSVLIQGVNTTRVEMHPGLGGGSAGLRPGGFGGGAGAYQSSAGTNSIFGGGSSGGSSGTGFAFGGGGGGYGGGGGGGGQNGASAGSAGAGGAGAVFVLW